VLGAAGDAEREASAARALGDAGLREKKLLVAAGTVVFMHHDLVHRATVRRRPQPRAAPRSALHLPPQPSPPGLVSPPAAARGRGGGEIGKFLC
jgi:hypothetical protein